MTTAQRPAALHFTWNVDLTISIRSGRRLVYRTRATDAKESAEAFSTGWFGDHPHRIRWTFKRGKNEQRIHNNSITA